VNHIIHCHNCERPYTNLLLSHQRINEFVVDQHIKGVLLTGSEVAGASVAAEVCKYLEKSVLELGGSDAFIILEDADIDQALAWAVVGRINNNGTTICATGAAVLRGIKTKRRPALSQSTFNDPIKNRGLLNSW